LYPGCGRKRVSPAEAAPTCAARLQTSPHSWQTSPFTPLDPAQTAPEWPNPRRFPVKTPKEEGQQTEKDGQIHIKLALCPQIFRSLFASHESC
jgi:hypothetical protein